MRAIGTPVPRRSKRQIAEFFHLRSVCFDDTIDLPASENLTPLAGTVFAKETLGSRGFSAKPVSSSCSRKVSSEERSTANSSSTGTACHREIDDRMPTINDQGVVGLDEDQTVELFGDCRLDAMANIGDLLLVLRSRREPPQP